MIKFLLKLSIICSFAFSAISHSALITSDLTEDYYFSYQGFDFAWASSANSERTYLAGLDSNTLLAADFHDGWEFAAPETLGLLTSNFTGTELLEKFTRSDGSYKHAFEFWNTHFDEVVPDVGTDNIIAKDIKSDWSWSIPDGEVFDELSDMEKFFQHLEIQNTDGTAYDTFYVRKTPVPEPSTLLIFAIALIALASKKRLFS